MAATNQLEGQQIQIQSMEQENQYTGHGKAVKGEPVMAQPVVGQPID
eukprot:CAMPEP_0170477904 /NCGR_PEP_ID=MMETSP0123-20130129/19064_1 /TAXON_ID=182087 /ORGANISM="Favella ehrenbergii, Strain Fehren 1" /LENGTH=46 /DNA_ID= /DNA_START= /DNA_END= /DNA_ORIENTATION=